MRRPGAHAEPQSTGIVPHAARRSRERPHRPYEQVEASQTCLACAIMRRLSIAAVTRGVISTRREPSRERVSPKLPSRARTASTIPSVDYSVLSVPRRRMGVSTGDEATDAREG